MTQSELRGHKQAIRAFLRERPTEKIAAQLAHAQDGKLSFWSCCCFVWFYTNSGNHQYEDARGYSEKHEAPSRRHFSWRGAESAYFSLGVVDRERRRRIIPILKAELRRRERMAPDGAVLDRGEAEPEMEEALRR